MDFSFLTDKSIVNIVNTIFTQYKIVGGIVSIPLFYLFKKFVKWTPWKSDDNLPDKIAKDLHLNIDKE